MGVQTKHWYAFGPFRIDPSEGVLRNNEDIVPLAPKVFAMLLALVESSGRVVQKKELLDRIWPDTFVEEANLNVNMSILRKALGDDSRKHQYIETIPKRGYRFVASVRELEETGAAGNGSTNHHSPEDRERQLIPWEQTVLAGASGGVTTAVATAPVHQSHHASGLWSFLRHHRRSSLIVLTGALVLLALGTFIFYRQITRPIKPPATVGNIKSIAVLPFKPLGAAPRDESLELGIADTLITRLSSLRQVIVRPTSAVRKFAALEQDPVAAGRRLGVETVLDGSFQRLDGKIRVTARLVRVEDGVPLWAGQFDEKLTNVFSLQDSITTKVANVLVAQLSGEEHQLIAKQHTTDDEAYRLYLLGRFYWSKKTEEGLWKGLDYFQQAIGRDPSCALAHAGISDCYNSLAGLSLSPPGEVLPKAETAAKRALALDDQLGEAHGSLALVNFRYRWDWAGAEKGFRRALDLNPNSATTHQWHCEYLTAMGRFDEAFAAISKAQRIDPLSLTISSTLGMTYHYAGQFDQALEQQRKTIELDPSFPWAHAYLSMAYSRKKMYPEAIAEAQKALSLSGGSPRILAGLGRVYAQAGQKKEAEEVLKRLHELGKRQYVTPFHTALIYEALGRSDETFKWLEKAYLERNAPLIYLRVLPLQEAFRSESRFNDLLRRMDLF